MVLPEKYISGKYNKRHLNNFFGDERPSTGIVQNNFNRNNVILLNPDSIKLNRSTLREFDRGRIVREVRCDDE